MKNKSTIPGFLLLCLMPLMGYSQIIYVVAAPPGTAGLTSYLWQFDLNTCEACPVSTYAFDNLNISTTPQDLLMLPNGDFLVMLSGTGGMIRLDPPSNTPVATIPGSFSAGIIHPNGNVYLTNGYVFLTFNATNNTTTTIGNFPPNMFVSQLFVSNGILYGFATLNPGSGTPTIVIVEINLSNPAATTVVQGALTFFMGSTTLGNTTYMVDAFTPLNITIYDVATNSETAVCPFDLVFITGLTALPPGAAPLPCVCFPSSAGTPAQTSANPCVPNDVIVNFNNDALQDYNDVVRYILYSNPANPLGSIIKTSETPIFEFDPPLVAGTNYYIARVVGNELNGSINPADPCLDISPAIPVTWRAQPQLLSLTGAGDLCVGDCTPVQMTLSGIPPFAYSWQLQQGGTPITPLTVQYFVQQSSITISACVPPGTSEGPVQFIVCGITDAYCGNP